MVYFERRDNARISVGRGRRPAKKNPVLKVLKQAFKRNAAGLLMFDIAPEGLRVLLAHPGGPYYEEKDDGYWTIPKGSVEMGEDFLFAAQREFLEETGIEPEAPFIRLGSYSGAKINHIWAFRKSYDLADGVTSNTFHMEWPPGSGEEQEFPEVDRCEWFDIEQAKVKISRRQTIMLYRLLDCLQNDIELFIQK